MAYHNGKRARAALLSMTAVIALAAVPAQAADQFKQAADGAGIECSVSARELTYRLAQDWPRLGLARAASYPLT